MEAIRALMAAKRTARAQRTQTINQARALILTGPDGIRTRFTRQARQSRSPSWPRCGPARALWSATTLCYPGASPAAVPSSWTTSSSGLTS